MPTGNYQESIDVVALISGEGNLPEKRHCLRDKFFVSELHLSVKSPRESSNFWRRYVESNAKTSENV
jgi:catechol-2,3-dioxygenase